MAEGASSRFAHLLKPIKDKRKNMEVDIASFLDEYLEELHNVAVSFDGGITTMNFSEAAMLLQSSACVYSKKVEYLFSLLSEMLDVLSSRRLEERREEDDGDDNDTTGDGPRAGNKHANTEDKFLSLDEFKTCNRIKKKVNKPFEFLKRTQKSFAPKAKTESGGNLLLSETGEELANIEDFRSHTCCLYEPSYVLMVDMLSLPLARLLHHPTNTDQQHGIPGEQPMHGAEGMEVSHDPDAEALNGDDLAGGFPDDNLEDEDMPPIDASIHDHQTAGASTENVVDVSLRRSDRRKQAEAAVAPKQKVDPWQLLDPYEELDTPKQPSKKGVVHRLPPGLETNTKKRKRTKVAPALEPLNVFIEKAFYSNAKKYPKNPMKVPTTMAFDTIFWKECKRRSDITRQQAKKRQQNRVVPEVEEEKEEAVEEYVAYPDQEADNDMEDDYEPLEDDQLMNAINEGLRSNEELLQGRAHNLLPDGGEGFGPSESYEDLLRQHVEQYFKAAEDYVESTDLIRRVDEWQCKMEPSLKEEENREPFDIKSYGSRLMESLEPRKRVGFEQVVGGRPDYEVCRTFLTMLMLANTMNVEIYSTSDGYGVGNFSIQLLSKKHHFEELEEYHAPSEHHVTGTT